MTREEFDFNFNRLGYVGKAEVAKLYINSLEQRIKSLEAQLTNTEQLTCDGCIHESKYYYDEPCENCVRNNPQVDYYKPKDTQ